MGLDVVPEALTVAWRDKRLRKVSALLHIRLMALPERVRSRFKSTTAWALGERGGATVAHNASNVKLRNAHLAAIERSKVL